VPLAVLALGWAAVTAWYLAWDAIARRRKGDGIVAGARGWLGPDWRLYMVEAALLTLLAALWFGSLGHGGWVLLFILLGAMTEWAARTRGAPRLLPGTVPGFLGGVARTVVAGGLLRWIL
jgi:hypothetical protein